MMTLGTKMNFTAHNIRMALEEHTFSKDRADNLREIADMLEEADKLLSWSAKRCDILAHLILTYKREGDVSRKHIESLLTQ
jgi:hypothetical protein